MKRRIYHQVALAICLLVHNSLCIHATTETTTDEDLIVDDEGDVVVTEETSASDELKVDDYLESLSNAELEQICHDRGMQLDPSIVDPTREHYLEAARACLSLEDEMNAVLAENPELAAELGNEIERMKAEKQRLEREREEMLVELEMLQDQLSGGIRPSPRKYIPMPVSSSSSGGKGDWVPGVARAYSSTTPWLIAQICALNIDAGGRRSAGICWDRSDAAFSNTPRARADAAARSGERFIEMPLSNMAM